MRVDQDLIITLAHYLARIEDAFDEGGASELRTSTAQVRPHLRATVADRVALDAGDTVLIMENRAASRGIARMVHGELLVVRQFEHLCRKGEELALFGVSILRI